jgi:predicted negative regulator of RcsB-dependent stress response
LLAGDRNLDQAIAGIDEGITKLGNIISLERRAIEFEIARTNTDGAVKRLDAICRRMARPETWLAEKGDLLLKSGRQAEAQAAYSEALAAIAKRPARLKSTESVKSLQTRIESALKTE